LSGFRFSNKILTTRGARQGRGLQPVIFNPYVDRIIDDWQEVREISGFHGGENEDD
jgi:hypothetical protein